MSHKKESGHNRILSMVYCSLFTVIIALCSYITIPVVIPFTLQTLGIFLALELLGGKKGTFCVLLYILLGIVGVPVFSGFRGGLGVLLSNTGGYIMGFIFLALIYWGITRLGACSLWSRIAGMLLGLIACYSFGTLWFVFAYSDIKNMSEMIPVLQICILPFIIPDIAKMFLSIGLRKLIYPALPEQFKNRQTKS
ncbi:MAG: biotin transporter BioY [Lachnospiraceae bacterium]|nr:biotin transporter BioY [Lachnospiraceae bacterium]